MKPAACVSSKVRHGPAGSPRSQNRNRIVSRAARLRQPSAEGPQACPKREEGGALMKLSNLTGCLKELRKAKCFTKW